MMDMEIQLIVDMLLGLVSIIGLTKIYPAIKKVKKVEYSDAHSLVHNETHAILLFVAITAYILGNYIFSLTTASIELICRFYFIKLVRSKRSHELTYPSDILFYTVKFLKRKLNGNL